MNTVKTAFMGTCAAAILAACATPQTNPHYKYSSKMPAETQSAEYYNAAPQQAPVSYQAAHSAPANPQPYIHSATYTPSSSADNAYQACLAKEQNHKLVGAAIGGTVGAYAGKKLAGDDNDTKGLVAGAALGGIAGYGAGNLSMNCDAAAYSPMQAQAAPQAARYSEPVLSQPVTMQPAAAQSAQTAPVPAETGRQNATQIDGYSYNSGGYVTQAAVTAPAPVLTQREYDIPAQAALPAPAAPAGMTYIVQEGDTAWSLSRKTCASLTDLKAMNNLEGDFLIKAGEAILLPASTC